MCVLQRNLDLRPLISVACKIIMSNCRNLRNLSRQRKKITITCPLPTHVLEYPSSPFAGQDDEVDLKFDMFLSNCPGEEDDNAYLW